MPKVFCCGTDALRPISSFGFPLQVDFLNLKFGLELIEAIMQKQKNTNTKLVIDYCMFVYRSIC
jgi:hypothetical protein